MQPSYSGVRPEWSEFQSFWLAELRRGPEGLIVELAERLDGAPG
jgi:hypothetical protein